MVKLHTDFIPDDDDLAALRQLAGLDDDIPKAINGRSKFAEAREHWQDHWEADKRLSHADKTLINQICRHFNRREFENTGRLLAWPSWATITARGHLSKATIFRGFRKLERLGALEIQHGRYNHQTKKRAKNVYRAIRPRFHPKTHQGFILKQDSLNLDSLNKEYAPPSAAQLPSKHKAKKKNGNGSFQKAPVPGWRLSTSPQATAASSAPPPVPRGPPPPSWPMRRPCSSATPPRLTGAADERET
jgi:hypothetical protein